MHIRVPETFQVRARPCRAGELNPRNSPSRPPFAMHGSKSCEQVTNGSRPPLRPVDRNA